MIEATRGPDRTVVLALAAIVYAALSGCGHLQRRMLGLGWRQVMLPAWRRLR